jgi:hypothetical protein
MAANAPTTDIGRPDFWWGTYGQGLLSDWWETTADLLAYLAAERYHLWPYAE